MKLNIKSIVVLISVCMTFCLSGCSTIDLLTQGEFDASGYVQGIMDATYKAEFDKYVELTQDTKENSQTAYDTVMDTKAQAFATYTAVTLTDESKAKFIEYSKQIYKNAKYEVLEATKTDKGFTVDVIISPITILQSITTQGEAFVTEFNAKNLNGDFAELTEEEFQGEYAKGIMEIFENNISKIQYGEAVTITVLVTLQEDKVYTLETDEFTKIDGVILQQ
jgi:hypothetical protein